MKRFQIPEWPINKLLFKSQNESMGQHQDNKRILTIIFLLAAINIFVKNNKYLYLNNYLYLHQKNEFQQNRLTNYCFDCYFISILFFTIRNIDQQRAFKKHGEETQMLK
ncbi:hypothetical protein ABPG74_007680 [Tetrahymena malaccensis]